MRAEFSLSAHSGVIAGALAANSVLFAWRCPPTLASGEPTTIGQKIKQLIVKTRTLTGFPTAQEIATGAYEVSAFGATPADYTGGTNLSDPATAANYAMRLLGPDLGPKPRQESVLQSGNVRIATTAGLSHAGTPTIAAFPFAHDSHWELAAAATVQQGAHDLVWTPSVEGSAEKKGLIVYPGKGFVVRNPIALGATGTIRIFVEVFWEES